ncbi:HAMP domain-containing protein [Bradyrhizobium elkanii]
MTNNTPAREKAEVIICSCQSKQVAAGCRSISGEIRKSLMTIVAHVIAIVAAVAGLAMPAGHATAAAVLFFLAFLIEVAIGVMAAIRRVIQADPSLILPDKLD